MPWLDNSTTTTTLWLPAISYTGTAATSSLFRTTTTDGVSWSVPVQARRAPPRPIPPPAAPLELETPAIIRREQEWQRAKTRALRLLLEYLTPEQRASYREHGWFIVQGGKTKTRYRIRAKEDLVANVDVLAADNDNVQYRLCAHCRPWEVPLGDQLLAQKLMLELDEDHFVRIANVHPRRFAA